MELTQLASTEKITNLSLSGSLDIAGVQDIEMDFSRLASGEQDIIIDFSGVTFIASLGMRMLLSAAKKLDIKDSKMVLHSVSPLVEKALTIAGLTTILPVVENESDAISLLQSQG